jgi:hypothetical protein
MSTTRQNEDGASEEPTGKYLKIEAQPFSKRFDEPLTVAQPFPQSFDVPPVNLIRSKLPAFNPLPARFTLKLPEPPAIDLNHPDHYRMTLLARGADYFERDKLPCPQCCRVNSQDCPQCQGAGWLDLRNGNKCPKCKGSRVVWVRVWYRGPSGAQDEVGWKGEEECCPNCYGTGIFG